MQATTPVATAQQQPENWGQPLPAAQTSLMKTSRTKHRVVKTLAPTDRGAIELARQYGQALVCVRHRTDAKGKIRHTTVELVVHSAPIRPRTNQVVMVKVEPHERNLHAVVECAGGKWDMKRRLWRIPSRVATILGLRDRIIHM